MSAFKTVTAIKRNEAEQKHQRIVPWPPKITFEMRNDDPDTDNSAPEFTKPSAFQLLKEIKLDFEIIFTRYWRKLGLLQCENRSYCEAESSEIQY